MGGLVNLLTGVKISNLSIIKVTKDIPESEIKEEPRLIYDISKKRRSNDTNDTRC